MDLDAMVAIIREGDKELFSKLDEELLLDKIAYDYTKNFLVAYGKFPEETTLFADLRLAPITKTLEPVAYHIDKLKHRKKMSKIRDIVVEATNIMKETTDIDTGLDKIRTSIMEVDGFKQDKGFIEVAETAMDRWEDYKLRAASTGLLGVSSPWKELDDMTLGWCEGNVVIVVGPTEIGKSWWLTKQFEHSFEHGDRPLFASIELIARTVVDRFDAVLSKIDHSNLRAGKLDAFSVDKYEKSMTTLSSSASRGWVADASVVSSPDHLRFMINRVKPNIVLLDGLYLMRVDVQKRSSNWEKIAEVVRQLQLIASEFKVPIIATSQFNKKIEKGGKKEGSISDMGYSHSIAQAADVAIGLQQTEYDMTNNDLTMTILKGREFKKKVDGIKVRWNVPFEFQFKEYTSEMVTATVEPGGEPYASEGTSSYDDDVIDLGD